MNEDEIHENILNEIDEEILTEAEMSEEEQELIDEEKEAERRKKGEELWIAVQSGNTKHLITKVASILNKYPDTRNSDVALMVKYWQVFEGLRGDQISINNLFKFERLTSIARVRAKIQNEYGLFKADNKIRRYRHEEEEVQREYQIASKPPVDYVTVYADESGKNDEFAIVGSAWILAGEGELNTELVNWVQERKSQDDTCPEEFHFNKIRNNGRDLQVYKDFISFAVERGHMMGFKAIAVNQTKLPTSNDDLNSELFYQIVRIGVEHEKVTGRIQLPKQIAYIKEQEEGESALRISQIQQLLMDNFKIHYDDQLRLNSFFPLESKLSRLIQIADLYTSSINRVLNHQKKNPDSKTAKDEFAEYVYELLGIEEIRYEATSFKQEVDKAKTDLATLYIFD